MARGQSSSWGAPRSSKRSTALTELDKGAAAAIELVGEPGIGKTRLLAELAGRADERNHLRAVGLGVGARAGSPFWVFVDALDEYSAGSSRSA